MNRWIEKHAAQPQSSALRWVWRVLTGVVLIGGLVGCQAFKPVAVPFDPSINLDVETQTSIARAERVVFVIPFSHWDTDWHETFGVYSRMADHNIQAAIDIAKTDPRYRYTFEQVFFVQHFWETHPESRTDLRIMIQNRQLSFAWAGITQPETSLAAPGVQWHNLLEGQHWIAETFGQEYIPSSAWQSDAFGNSAGLPAFLSQAGIFNMYLGRWGQRCPTGQENCQSLPQSFYWQSPLPTGGGYDSERILVTSVPYATAWGVLLNKDGIQDQITALKSVIDEQFKRGGTSRYLFLPYGFDFLDPDPALPNLVKEWNLSNRDTVLVISDPETAFQYLSGEQLPQIQVDLNPLWQGFYGTRPFARIADKESEFYLTATDKFGQFLEPAVMGDWSTTSVNAHYDNISAVSYDAVWTESQKPRFERAVNQAAKELTAVLAGITEQAVPDATAGAGMLFFNPLSWPRGGVVEVHRDLSEMVPTQLPVQPIDNQTVAVYLEPLPPIGYSPPKPSAESVPHPVTVSQAGQLTTLSNGQVSVGLNVGRGGTFEQLIPMGDPSENLIAGVGDDLVYIQDNGDVYGARFGDEIARQSQSPAHIELLANGPLIASVKVNLALGGQPVTKTITLQADSPLIQVTLQMRALPGSSALIQTHTIFQTDTRTDDLGFAAFEHQVDTQPIHPGDITYRRQIFYPITYWSDVSSNGYGLSLISHGLQGVGGATELNLLLVRSVNDPRDQEGVNDTDLHTFRYAYYPHRGDVQEARSWLKAYEFNQPIIPAWLTGDRMTIQLPFQDDLSSLPIEPAKHSLPIQASLASAAGQGTVIVDTFRRSNRSSALIINYKPSNPMYLKVSETEIELPSGWLTLISR